MTKICFQITGEEVQSHSRVKLTSEQIEEILSIVENDSVLWENIERSIKGAIELVLEGEP